MAASYCALPGWRGLSRFEHPMPAAWSGVAVAHFWPAASARRSPLRAMLQGLAALDDARWVRLRAAWGRCVLGASQFVVLLGLIDYASDTYMVAPLLLGAASVLVHQGVLTGNRWYHAVAVAEVVLALHADFFVPSWLDRRDVLWVLLLIWAALLLARRALSISAPAMGGGAGLLALAVMAHVAYHRPWSDAGLWAVAFAAMLAALTPRDCSCCTTGRPSPCRTSRSCARCTRGSRSPGTSRAGRVAARSLSPWRSCASSPSSRSGDASSFSPPRSGPTSTTCGPAWLPRSSWPGPSRPSTTGRARCACP